MSTKSHVPREDEDAVRVLDTRLVRSHYAHLRSEPGIKDKRCSFCQQGMGAIVKTVKEEKPEADVVSDNRSDEEGDATPASDSRRSWEQS